MGLFSRKNKSGQNRNAPDTTAEGRTTEIYTDRNGEEVVVQFAPGAKERLGGLDLDALLRDVAGIGAESDTQAATVWARFDKMSASEQEKALQHKFSIENRYSGAGWEHPEVQLDGKTYRYRISYIGPGIGRLVECVNGLGDGDEASLTWMDEPGAYSWYFARRGDLVYVEAPDADEGVYLRFDAFCKAINGLEGTYTF